MMAATGLLVSQSIYLAVVVVRMASL